MTKFLRSSKGFTLVEVLIALIITAILSAAMFKIYVNQHHAWMIQESEIEMQQNARAAIDELTRQLRMAGFGLPNSMPPLEAFDTNPDTIAILYKSGINCEVSIDKPMPQPSSELDCIGNVGCFFVGQMAYIYDPFVEEGEYFEISFVQETPAKIQHNKWPLSRSYPEGSVIMTLDRVKFFIDHSDKLHPKLMVQMMNGTPQVYAEDIVDLQFNYVLKNGMTMAQPPMLKEIRRIGIDLTARTQNPDIEFEDEPYRYEHYQSNVYLRNLGS